MGVMCLTGLPRPGGWRRSHQGGHLGECFDDAAAGMFLKTSVPCLSLLHPTLVWPHGCSRSPHVAQCEGF